MRPPPRFDRLAKAYRWMELFSFGRWLERTRGTFLAQGNEAQRALVLGDGDGRFTQCLLRANPQVQVDAVDASGAMLKELLGRAGPDAGRVTVHLADARIWEPIFATRGYDLIATHFFLDCLTNEEILVLAQRLYKEVAPGALWMVSEFAIPEGRVVGTAGRGLVWVLYLAFGWLTGLAVRRLPDHVAAMKTSGFKQIGRVRRLGGLLVAELWERRAEE